MISVIKEIPKQPPNVLCISGHDPSGGAGIQADIEAIKACEAHALSVISCNTIQDSHTVHKVLSVNTKVIAQQIQVLLDDSPISAIKIGLIASLETISCIAKSIEPLFDKPIVLDPVFSAGASNKTLTKTKLINKLKDTLLNKVTIITPNTHELKLLTNEDNPDIAAKILLSMGVKHVLLTGTHDESTTDVVNTLYSKSSKKQWSWKRLVGEYHGSGCTLAASLAAFLAQGLDIEIACQKAQKFTWDSLNNAYQSGKGQQTPNRTPCNN